MVLTRDGQDLRPLARAAQAGDRAAFGSLISCLSRPLHRYLLVRTGRVQDAEEVAQETLLRAWERLDEYDASRPLQPWIYAIARRLALDLQRRERRRPADRLGSDPPSDELSPAGRSECAEQRQNLWQLAASVLDEEQRSALWLRYAEGLSPGEIGTALGRTSPSVRVLLFRARRVLGQHLTASGHAPAPAPLLPPQPLPRVSHALRREPRHPEGMPSQ